MIYTSSSLLFIAEWNLVVQNPYSLFLSLTNMHTHSHTNTLIHLITREEIRGHWMLI
uniref:Uncharacterized protein n=1 Tax=Rhizophora mucronata TaxID=61149 RepID=A0A2P2PFC8_RHIMU